MQSILVYKKCSKFVPLFKSAVNDSLSSLVVKSLDAKLKLIKIRIPLDFQFDLGFR